MAVACPIITRFGDVGGENRCNGRKCMMSWGETEITRQTASDVIIESVLWRSEAAALLTPINMCRTPRSYEPADQIADQHIPIKESESYSYFTSQVC